MGMKHNMMIRKDVCPSCGKQLQQFYDNGYTRWYCPRCKYKRYDGAEENPWKAFRRKNRR